MSLLETTILYLIFMFILLWVWQAWDHKHRLLPPGPFQLPLIGNIWQIMQADSRFSFIALLKLSKTYGKIMSVKLGTVDAVVIMGYELVSSCLHKEDFQSRIDFDWILYKSFGKRIGLAFGRYEHWKPLRRFTHRSLKEFGFGKAHVLETFLNTEFEELTRTLDTAVEENKGIVEPLQLFHIPSINLTWASAAAMRFDHKDPRIIKLEGLVVEWLTALKVLDGVAVAYPFLLKWFPNYFSIDRLKFISDELVAFIKDSVNHIREQGAYKAEPVSFVEDFLQRMESDKIGSQDVNNVFTEECLISTLVDLFVAGSDTITITASSAIRWITMYPEIQDRVRNELEAVVGCDRLATIDDKPNLPYTRAFLLEVHRRSHIVPLSPRKVYKDTRFEDYVIPKGSILAVSFYSVMMDEDFWGDPQNFRPSRFLDEKNHIINAERVVGFGMGPRNCIAESIAEMTLFGFLTKLIQRYEFLPVESGQIFNDDPVIGVLLRPKPFKVRVQRRP